MEEKSEELLRWRIGGKEEGGMRGESNVGRARK